MRSDEFVRAAEVRGMDLRHNTMRELYRVGLLAPLIEVRSKRPPHSVPNTPASRARGPRPSGTTDYEVRAAYDDGRLADPGLVPYRPRLRFDRVPTDGPRWWNGLVYSRYQLLTAYRFRDILPGRIRLDANRKVVVRLRDPRESMRPVATYQRRLAILLTVLEPRYLPSLNPDWTALTNADFEQWDEFRSLFDPAAVLHETTWSADDVLKAAEDLLHIANRTDPNGRWTRLIARAPKKSWDDLRREPLVAMEHRIAAELLLQFHEDLAARGIAKSLPPLDQFNFHPRHERITERSDELDQILGSLGISPHPTLVLVVEGESEELVVHRLLKQLGLCVDASLMRVVVMRGADHDLTKLAAFAAAPLVGTKRSDGWDMIRPPTRLHILLDPDGAHSTPEGVARRRQAILEEIRTVVRFQGVDPATEDLEHLVTLKTWNGGCFEFAHFTDQQLLEGLRQISATCNEITDAALLSSLRSQRSKGRDIKHVWRDWSEPHPRKLALADAMWPIIEQQTQAATDELGSDPQITQAILDAYYVARSQPHGTFVLSGTPWQ